MGMMLELILAYGVAAGMGVTVVYLARENRKQGWQRPDSRWFGIELQNHQFAMDSPKLTVDATQEPVSEPAELMPQLLQLNRALAAHVRTTRPEVQVPQDAELVSTRRV
jgi:hypothetical protein